MINEDLKKIREFITAENYLPRSSGLQARTAAGVYTTPDGVAAAQWTVFGAAEKLFYTVDPMRFSLVTWLIQGREDRGFESVDTLLAPPDESERKRLASLVSRSELDAAQCYLGVKPTLQSDVAAILAMGEPRKETIEKHTTDELRRVALAFYAFDSKASVAAQARMVFTRIDGLGFDHDKVIEYLELEDTLPTLLSDLKTLREIAKGGFLEPRKGHQAEDVDGEPCDILDTRAARWTKMGAVRKIAPRECYSHGVYRGVLYIFLAMRGGDLVDPTTEEIENLRKSAKANLRSEIVDQYLGTPAHTSQYVPAVKASTLREDLKAVLDENDLTFLDAVDEVIPEGMRRHALRELYNLAYNNQTRIPQPQWLTDPDIKIISTLLDKLREHYNDKELLSYLEIYFGSDLVPDLLDDLAVLRDLGRDGFLPGDGPEAKDAFGSTCSVLGFRPKKWTLKGAIRRIAYREHTVDNTRRTVLYDLLKRRGTLDFSNPTDEELNGIRSHFKHYEGVEIYTGVPAVKAPAIREDLQARASGTPSWEYPYANEKALWRLGVSAPTFAYRRDNLLVPYLFDRIVNYLSRDADASSIACAALAIIHAEHRDDGYHVVVANRDRSLLEMLATSPWWAELAELYVYGSTKYERGNYRKGQTTTHYIRHALNHFHAIVRGELIDESGLHALTHLLWNLIHCLENETNDDRLPAQVTRNYETKEIEAYSSPRTTRSGSGSD